MSAGHALASLQGKLYAYLDNVFLLNERKSTAGQELMSGITTFLTMSYVLLVNPQILAQAGIPAENIVVSTALSAFLSSFISGITSNLPIGLAPGVGLSAYLVFGLILGDNLTIKEAFTTCFVAGICVILLSATGVSQLIMKLIPQPVKLATIVGMGLQIALIGFTSINLVIPQDQTIVGLGPLTNYKLWISFFGVQLIGSLIFHNIKGGILIGLIILTVLSWCIEDSFPPQYVELPVFRTKVSDFIEFYHYDIVKCLPGIISIIFIGICDISGVVYGMSSLAGVMREDESIPGSVYVFIASSVGTCVSACTGGSPIIVYVESAAGIEDGGRTGLSAVMVGFMFLISLVFAPFLASIPVTATSPVSILIGVMMMSHAGDIRWYNMKEAIPAFLTMVIMPFTFSITNGIFFGLLSAFSFYLFSGEVYYDCYTFMTGITLSKPNYMTGMISHKKSNKNMSSIEVDHQQELTQSSSLLNGGGYLEVSNNDIGCISLYQATA